MPPGGHAFASDLGSIYEVTSREWILKAGIRNGLQLTCGQLKQIIAALKIERPASNAKKVQLATCLVNALFDDAEASRDERKEMSANILKIGSCENLDLDVMSTVASLDPENAESFRPAVSQIIREFTEKAFDAGRNSEQELTTDELTKLRKEKAELLIQKDQTIKDDVAKMKKLDSGV